MFQKFKSFLRVVMTKSGYYVAALSIEIAFVGYGYLLQEFLLSLAHYEL